MFPEHDRHATSSRNKQNIIRRKTNMQVQEEKTEHENIFGQNNWHVTGSENNNQNTTSSTNKINFKRRENQCTSSPKEEFNMQQVSGAKLSTQKAPLKKSCLHKFHE